MQRTIKIRKFWGNVNPAQFPHTTKKGKKGYSRKENKRIEKDY